MEQRNDNTNNKCFTQLVLKDRYKIEALLDEGITITQIAKNLGFSRRTIQREIKAGTVILRKENPSYKKNEPMYIEEFKYKADYAQTIHEEKAKNKGRNLKIDKDINLANYIEDKIIKDKWSPDVVVGRIKEEGLLFNTSICTKTIYNYIDKGIFYNLTNKDLLIKRNKKKQKYHKVRIAFNNKKGKSIEDRPPDIDDRKEIGHWELDLVVGKKGTPKVIMTLIERKTRLSVYILAKDKTNNSIIEALHKAQLRLKTNFGNIIKTITTDNGVEFLDTLGLKQASGCQDIYYCHPYCSYEKGSNENGNRILRRFIPKGTNIDSISEEELQEIEDWVNNYPRRILNYKTAKEKLTDELKDVK